MSPDSGFITGTTLSIEEVEVFRLMGTIGKAAPLTGTYLYSYLVKL